jgi:hypothetical protein
MACDLKTKHDVAYGILEQSTWGTAELGSSTFQRIDCEPADFDPDARFIELNRVTGYRDLDYNTLIHHQKGSAPMLPIAGHIKKDDLGLFLYGVIQDVSEGGISPYTKTFTFPEDGQPDFSADEGIKFTVAKKMPTAADSNSIRDAICRKLVLTWEPEGESGVGHMTAEMVGRGEVNYAYDMSSATLTAKDNDLFYFHDLNTLTVDINDGTPTAVIPTRIEIEIGNNMIPVSVDTGTPGQYGCILLRNYYCTAKITCAWDATVDDLRQEAVDNSATVAAGSYPDREWIVEWGTGGNDGHLKFAMNAQPGPAPHVDEDLNVVEFTLRCLRRGSTKPLTVTLSDDIDQSW